MTMTAEPEWQVKARLAEHYLALGMNEVNLGWSRGKDDPIDDLPWHLVNSVRASKDYDDTPRSFTFGAYDPESHLSFSWYLDVLDWGSEKAPNIELLNNVIARIDTPHIQVDVRTLIAKMVAKFEARAFDAFERGRQDMGTAAVLRELAKPSSGG